MCYTAVGLKDTSDGTSCVEVSGSFVYRIVCRNELTIFEFRDTCVTRPPTQPLVRCICAEQDMFVYLGRLQKLLLKPLPANFG